MSDFIRVQPGPANYYSYSGALDELSVLYSQKQLDSALWIHGERAGNAASRYLPSQYVHSGDRKILFHGHCTHEFVDAAAEHAVFGTQLVIGIGGGGVLDAAKALASKLDLPFIAIPTIAATCAAFTPLSVWYDGYGKALGYEIFKRAAELVLVEPRIILNAPAEYLRAGLADTLAKWYEADILCSRESRLPHTAQLGLGIAKTLNDVLLTKGENAFRAMETGELTEDFIEVVDAIIAGGGLVGGLGERFTRIAAAHAVHNGLSALPDSREYLHGLKVAYGILVQTALCAKESDLADLSAQFHALGLPTHLADFSINISDQSQITQFIDATLAPHESIHLLPFVVDAKKLGSAIELVEQIVNRSN